MRGVYTLEYADSNVKPKEAPSFNTTNINKSIKSKKFTQYFAALSANIGAFTTGTAWCWTATALPEMKREGPFVNMTKSEASWVTSIVFLGSLLSCPVAGFCLEKFGRRMSLLILTAPLVGAWMLIAFADNLPMIYVGRFIIGVCCGSYGMVISVFIAEISEKSIRGTLSCLYELMICMGCLYTYIVGSFTTYKVQALACGFIPILSFTLLLITHESPRFLMEKNKHTEAVKSLLWYRGAKSAGEIQLELSEVEESVASNKIATKGWRTLIEAGGLRALFIGLGLMMFLQFTFINPILANQVEIFKAAGSFDEYISTIIIGTTQTMATIIPILTVDRYGRRVLLLLSTISVAFFVACLGVYFHIKNVDELYAAENLKWLPISSLIGYVISMSIGIAPLPWVIIGEIVPTNAKGIASGIILTWFRLVGFAVIYFFHDILDIFGYDGGYWFISSLSIIAFVFVYFCIPETKGKSLDEIQLDLE